MTITLQNRRIELCDVARLYPAAMIRYADGTVTPISLEWYDSVADERVELLHYAICVHYKQESTPPLIFTYSDRAALDAGVAQIAAQLDPPTE